MLERLESQLSDLLAFLANFIAGSEDKTSELFEPLLHFLATWLDCEERRFNNNRYATNK